MNITELAEQLDAALKAAKADLHREQAANKLLLSPEAAAERLDVGRTTIFALMKTGEIKSVTIGRSRRIPAAALEEYVHGLEQDGQ